MRYEVPIVSEKNIVKENSKVIITFILAMIPLFFIQDNKKYAILLHFMYSTFLLSISIIVLNTMKFNVDRFSKILGVVLGFTGMVEIIYVFASLNLSRGISNSEDIKLILSGLTDVFPVIGIFLSFNYFKKIKNLIVDMSVSLIVIAVSFNLLVGFVNSLYGITDYFKYYIVETFITMLMAFVSIHIYKQIKKNNNSLDEQERCFFSKTIILLMLSRIPTILHFLIKDVLIEDMLSQIITNISMYYLYKYIAYKNVKKPYLQLNEINEELTKKTYNLKINNKKLMSETSKIQELKDLLTDKEFRLQSTLDASINSIIVFSRDKEIEYANKTFKNKFGEKIKSGLDLKDNLKNYEDILKNIDHVFNKKANTEDYIYAKNNKSYQAIFAPLIIKNEIEGALCILIDKTKKKEFEQKIIEANARYENFLESIGDGIVVLQEGKVIYANKACREIFKDNLDEIDFCIDKKSDNKEEMYIIDGRKVYVEMSFSEYTKNGENKTIVAIRDVTLRKIGQMKLKKSQKSYSRFIDILPDGICLLDQNLNIDYANKSLIDMLEYDTLENVHYKSVKNMIKLKFNEANKFEMNMKSVLNDNKYIILLEQKLMTNSDKIIQVDMNAIPFAIDDNKYIMLIIKDLTNKKTSELAEQELLERLKTDKIKTEFFANMSHELKTPLNVISSSNQLVDSFYKNGKIEDYNDNVKSHIELVRQSSYRLQRLINNIIDLTKMESGFYKLKLTKHNIVTLIEDLFMKVEKYASKKDISILFDTESEEINMYIDKSEIERIILNLLSNCIKFTKNGGNIYVNIYDREDTVVISVKDTGVGIPKNKLKLIFEEFAQVDRTLSRNTEGSGIGLTIVKNLVELHGGNIKVISEEDKGTEFIISIPISESSGKEDEEDRKIYNIDEKIKIEFSDIYY